MERAATHPATMIEDRCAHSPNAVGPLASGHSHAIPCSLLQQHTQVLRGWSDSAGGRREVLEVTVHYILGLEGQDCARGPYALPQWHGLAQRECVDLNVQTFDPLDAHCFQSAPNAEEGSLAAELAAAAPIAERPVCGRPAAPPRRAPSRRNSTPSRTCRGFAAGSTHPMASSDESSRYKELAGSPVRSASSLTLIAPDCPIALRIAMLLLTSCMPPDLLIFLSHQIPLTRRTV